MMLCHKGTQIIETERLCLRKACYEDIQPMFDNWASDPQVTKYLTWSAHSSVEITEKVVKSWISQYDLLDYYQWVIVLKAIDQPIGSISVVSQNDKAKKVEIGYCLGRAWWRQGIMSEALRAVMDYLFDEVGMNRIEAKHDPNNRHSGAVMRKCGMKYERTTRESCWNNQGICDTACYALLKKERQQAQHFMADYAFTDDETLVQEIYARFDENTRLTKNQAANVEFLTTVRYIEKYLKPNARILDIGAGVGEYSFYFSQKGFSVNALELADANVSAFRAKMTDTDRIDLEQGNALDLSRYEDHSFDIVLMLGPLYHFHNDRDKLQCLAEARRICKRDGKLFFSFISNDIVIMTMQQAHPEYLLKGDYHKDTFRLDDFPFVFHTLARCREILSQAGIRICHEVATDGVSELLEDLINGMDEETYRQYLRYHFYLCEKPECIGMSNHWLFVGDN